MAIKSLNEDLEGSQTTLNCLETMVLYIAIESTYLEKFISVTKKIRRSLRKFFTSKLITSGKKAISKVSQFEIDHFGKKAISKIGHFKLDHFAKKKQFRK